MTHQPTDRYKLYHFKVDLILGRGGSGTVYRGVDPNTNKVYAIKLFHENFFSNRSHIKKLEKSVKKFSTFKHQNMIQIYEFISGDEGYCVVEEYVDGPDLRWYLENRPWNLQERLVITAQICNGLQYLHDQGFVHHDLKPGNVLFTRKGVAKLSDFSLVQGTSFFGLLASPSITNQVTPMYVAPEIISKKKATPRSDIYSLGIMMYIMFTGQVPFQVDNLQLLYECHQKVMPLPPREINKDCPLPLSELIMQMISKKPEKRPENCHQIRIRLANIGRSRI